MAATKLLWSKETVEFNGPCVVSPCNRYVAVGNLYAHAMVYALSDGSVVMKGSDVGNKYCAFDPTGDRFATISHGGYVYVYETATGAMLMRTSNGGLEGHGAAIAFSPDGRKIAGVSSQCLCAVYDTDTAPPYAALVWRNARDDDDTSPANLVAFRPDGRQIVTACQDGRVRVLDAANGSVLANIPLRGGHPDLWLSPAVISPDGATVVGVDIGIALNSRQLATIDCATGTCKIAPATVDMRNARAAAMLSGKAVAVAYADGRLVVWPDPAAAHSVLLGTGARTQDECSLAISPDCTRLARFGSPDRYTHSGQLEIWDTSTFATKTRILAAVVSQRRLNLPHVPQELWQLINDDFV